MNRNFIQTQDLEESLIRDVINFTTHDLAQNDHKMTFYSFYRVISTKDPIN